MPRLKLPRTWLYYYRVSSKEQESDGHALERYREQGIELGLLESNLYYDIESGASDTRPGLLAMCDRLEHERGLSGLIVPYLSRLARDQTIWAKVKKILLENSLDFIDLRRGTTPIDLASPEGEFDVELEAILAQRQRRRIQHDSIEGHRNRRRQLRSMFAPFGYIVDRDTRKPVPNLKQYREGCTFWAAAQQLIHWFLVDQMSMSRTVNTALKEWGPCTLHRCRPTTQVAFKDWLRNPALRGCFYNTLTDEIFVDNHQPLITHAQYIEIVNRLKFPATPKSKPHRLAKLLFCSDCGSIIRRLICHGGKYEYLYCKGARPSPGKSKVCDRTKTLQYSDVENNIIFALTAKATKIGEQAAEPDIVDDVDPGVAKLVEDIKKLELLNDPDLDSAIDAKKSRLSKLLAEEGVSTPVIDHELVAQYQADAADVGFWMVASDEERGLLYRQLISKVLVSADGSVDVAFTF